MGEEILARVVVLYMGSEIGSECALRTERLYEQSHLDPAPDDYP